MPARRSRQRTPRPPPHWFTLGSLRSFGRRLVHPPPPSEKERYFLYMSPRFDVSMEDVVASKHLPPLSLQDFEDYLKYVEGTPQNLYFHLWLQRYRTLHHSWASSVLPTVPSSSTGGYRPRDLWERLNPCQDRTLKDEFAYAKSRWLDERALARLDLSEEMRRGVLDISNLPPLENGSNELTFDLPSFPNQPTPSKFDAIQTHIISSLRAAFNRFLRLAFGNAGLWHMCAGHINSMLLLLVPGLAMWFLGVLSGGRRGLVVGSLPLIWIGLSFMLMTANGHCFVVWSTGDARQLYPHELVRPIPPELAKAPPVYSLDLPPQPGVASSLPLPPQPHSPETRFGRVDALVGLGIEGRLGRKGSVPQQLGRKGSVPQQLGRKGSEAKLGRKGSQETTPRLGRKESDPRLVDQRIGRKASEPRLGRKGSALFSLASSGGGRRGSGGGFLGIFGRNEEEDKEDELEAGTVAVDVPDPRRTLEQTREMDFKLPPARKTKDLTRPDVLAQHQPLPLPQPQIQIRSGWEDDVHQVTVTSTADIGEYKFTEDEDFGIVVSEAYEEDEDYPYPREHHHHHHLRVSVEAEPVSGGSGGGDESSVPGSSTRADQPLMSIQVQTPEVPTAPVPVRDQNQNTTPAPSSRRTALPDIFSFASLSPTAAVTSLNPPPSASSSSPFNAPPKYLKSTIALDWALSQARPGVSSSRRGSKQMDAEGMTGESGDAVLMNPYWRTFLGPMTLVHDPLVRRAHWAVTVRCGVVAFGVCCGMALGLIR
ncbi:hypothetical protein FRC09_004012 [Ceratobasidium sp. 395]|nr:hypothetical protein FRC09_004012 [Ceratobasidium sp. 395]